LNNIKVIDDHLFGRTDTSEALLFEANMILNSGLCEDVQHQQNAYAVIKQYSRQQLRAEIESAKHKLETEPQHRGFMQRIVNLFKKH